MEAMEGEDQEDQISSVVKLQSRELIWEEMVMW